MIYILEFFYYITETLYNGGITDDKVKCIKASGGAGTHQILAL